MELASVPGDSLLHDLVVDDARALVQRQPHDETQLAFMVQWQPTDGAVRQGLKQDEHRVHHPAAGHKTHRQQVTCTTPTPLTPASCAHRTRSPVRQPLAVLGRVLAQHRLVRRVRWVHVAEDVSARGE